MRGQRITFDTSRNAWVPVTTVRYRTRRVVARWAAFAAIGAGLAASVLYAPSVHADVLRCAVTVDATGNVFLDDCDSYTDGQL